MEFSCAKCFYSEEKESNGREKHTKILNLAKENMQLRENFLAVHQNFFYKQG